MPLIAKVKIQTYKLIKQNQSHMVLLIGANKHSEVCKRTQYEEARKRKKAPLIQPISEDLGASQAKERLSIVEALKKKCSMA